jgi:DNA-binding transcriptional LysR family regulator
MNLWHLEIFETVAESGSISLASQKLHISQPAVTSQIKQLEARLGVTLFDRLPRGVRLTDAGGMLREYTRRIFALSREAQQRVQDLKELRMGSVLIGASSTIGNYFLPDHIADFHRRHPNIHIELRVANTHAIVDDLLGDRITLGFVEGSFESDELEASRFMEDAIIPVADATHPSALRRERQVPSALAHETLIVREPGSGTREYVDRLIHEQGLRFAGEISLGSTELVKRLVRARAGIALLSEWAVRDELRTGAFVRLSLSGVSIARPWRWIKLRRRHLSPAIETFLQAVLEIRPEPPSRT